MDSGGLTMRIKVTKTKVYKLAELPDNIRAKAIGNLSDINVNFDWWDCTYDDAQNVGIKITGFDIDRGAYCEGDFIDSAATVAYKILSEHGDTCDTHKTALRFLDDIKKNFTEEDLDKLEDEFKRSILEDYRIILQKEYEYLTSEAAIVETIDANEYEFDERGRIA
jgi:hypothetical protein